MDTNILFGTCHLGNYRHTPLITLITTPTFISPVDGYFASSSFDQTARLWNTEYVYPLRIFAGHEDSVEVGVATH